MPPSDFRHESDLPPDEASLRVEPPHIVNLPSSFDMTEFPSEAVEEAPIAPALTEAAAPAPVDPPPAATVIEFPAHPPEPAPAMFSAAAHSRVITLADILEERSGMEWRESVAFVHKLCEQLKRRSQRAPVLLEPRNIRVTPDGDVTLLSEQLGGDPLVMQIGRLLRTMLMGRHAPPELRLLLAQATFELPIFQSVDEIDAALTQIERAEDARPPLTEIVPFTSHLVTRTTTTTLEKPIESGHVVTTRTIKPPSPPRRVRMRIPKLDLLIENYGATMIAGLAAVIAAVALFIAAPSLVNPTDPNDASNRPAVVVRQPAPTTGTGPEARLPGPAPNGVEGPAPSGVERPALNAPAPTPPERSAPAAPDAARPIGPAPVGPRRSAMNERVIEPNRGTATAPAGSAASAPRDLERFPAGTNGGAPSTEFDALLQANPLYEPKASDLAPESLTAFRNSQKLLLPVLAQRGYDRARAALASGDVDRAIASARETAAILERPAAAPAAHLRDDVQRILEEAGTAKATADEVVYSRSDPGIVAPRPISRQFPATTPIGVPPHRVGTLEMIIGKDGTVEFVKLHTPLNRYHERMIVSAAKAWLYRPATRGGRPVRYRITVTINLPENGTY